MEKLTPQYNPSDF